MVSADAQTSLCSAIDIATYTLARASSRHALLFLEPRKLLALRAIHLHGSMVLTLMRYTADTTSTQKQNRVRPWWICCHGYLLSLCYKIQEHGAAPARHNYCQISWRLKLRPDHSDYCSSVQGQA